MSLFSFKVGRQFDCNYPSISQTVSDLLIPPLASNTVLNGNEILESALKQFIQDEQEKYNG